MAGDEKETADGEVVEGETQDGTEARTPLRARRWVRVSVLVAAGVFLAGAGVAFGRLSAPGPGVVQVGSATVATPTGKSVDQDRKDALAAAANLLTVADKSPTGATAQTRLEKLSSGDSSVIDPSLSGLVYTTDFIGSNKSLQTSTYEALVTIASYVSKNGSVTPLSTTQWANVYVDQHAGVAFVPMSSFYDGGNDFNLQMVWVDGTWKLEPYSLLDIVRLSDALSTQSSSSSSSSASATPSK